MKDINQENLDTAIALGDAICRDLGICCKERGQVIHRIYEKLGELKHKEDTTGMQQSHEGQTE